MGQVVYSSAINYYYQPSNIPSISDTKNETTCATSSGLFYAVSFLGVYFQDLYELLTWSSSYFVSTIHSYIGTAKVVLLFPE